MRQLSRKMLISVIAMVLCFGLLACNRQETPNEMNNETNNEQSESKVDQEQESNSDKEPSSESEGENSQYNIKDQSISLVNATSLVKTCGRCSVVENGIACDFTASGIEWNLYAVGEVRLEVTVTADTYFTVWVDGVRSANRFYAQSGKQLLTVADFETEGSHSIRILKQTEAKNSLCIFHSLYFSGELTEAPKNRDLYIEFLGDSISCGYGNLCSNGTSDPGNALNQDGTQAYAFLTAEKLGADCSVISASGVGVAKGYREFTMDTFFAKQSYYRSSSSAFTATRVPDLVVINLGTNDDSTKADASAFRQKAEELVTLVRQTYGTDVPIVWVYGMMKDGMKDEVKSVWQTLGGESSGLYLCELSKNTAGGGGHPNLSAHATAAEQLSAFITAKEILA